MENQYACCKGIGATDALVKFSADIIINLDSKETVAEHELLLDFSKALFKCYLNMPYLSYYRSKYVLLGTIRPLLQNAPVSYEYYSSIPG